MIGTWYWKIPKVKVNAGDCSPRLHVTLGHSGEPGESYVLIAADEHYRAT